MGLDDIKSYMIGVIVFVAVISSGVFMFGEFKSLDTSLDSSNELGQFNQSLNKANNITTSVEGIQDSITSVNPDNAGVIGWLNVLVGSAYNGLQAIFGSIDFMSIVADESAEIFGIPTFIISLLLLIIILIIGFGIWAAIFRL